LQIKKHFTFRQVKITGMGYYDLIQHGGSLYCLY
jgi:hypothetical protein